MSEQIGGLAGILERYRPGQVLWSGPPAGTVTARDLQQKLGQAEIPLMLAQAGQALDLGDGAQLRVLNVSRRGATLALEWGSFRALLPVGLDFDQLEVMQADSEPGAGQRPAAGGERPARPQPAWTGSPDFPLNMCCLAWGQETSARCWTLKRKLF